MKKHAILVKLLHLFEPCSSFENQSLTRSKTPFRMAHHKRIRVKFSETPSNKNKGGKKEKRKNSTRI